MLSALACIAAVVGWAYYSATGNGAASVCVGLLAACAAGVVLHYLAAWRHRRLIRRTVAADGLAVRSLRSAWVLSHRREPRPPWWMEHAFYNLAAVTPSGEERRFLVVIMGAFGCLFVTEVALLRDERMERRAQRRAGRGTGEAV